MSDQQPKHQISEEASLSYYLSGLEEAIDQGNTTSAIFFLHKIVKINTARITYASFASYVTVFFVILNFVIAISNTYALLLK